MLRIGSTIDRRQRVVIRDVSLLAGRIRASSVIVPGRGSQGCARHGLTIDGVPYAGRPNTLVPLGGHGLPRRAAGGGRPREPRRRDGSAPAPRPAARRAPGRRRPHDRRRRRRPSVGARDDGPARLQGADGRHGREHRSASARPGWRCSTSAIPYLWGGANPRVGLDCSGPDDARLPAARHPARALHGPAVAGGRARRPQGRSPATSCSSTRPCSGPGHVGIYLGGGRFVQAPHTGDVVKISSLRSARYALTYVGAVRPY